MNGNIKKMNLFEKFVLEMFITGAGQSNLQVQPYLLLWRKCDVLCNKDHCLFEKKIKRNKLHDISN